MKKHILVISQYFYPEQFRINDICTEWVKRGYKVTVVTGIPNYPKGKFFNGYGIFKKRSEIINGVEVIRLPIIPRGNNSIMLALNYFSFVISGYLWKLFTKINSDFVFIFEVSPMTQALPGVWYAQKENIPCYLYVQDLWPENVEIITGISDERVIGSIGKMVDYIYRHCTKIFTSSSSFVKSVHDRGVPLDKIEYWPQYAEDFYLPLEQDSIEEIPDDDLFNIIFAGNIGEAQGLEVLPQVAEIIKTQSDAEVRFNIVGDGRFKNELIELIDKMKLKDMFNFIPKQPATRIPEFMAASDAAFISLADSPLFAKTIPAKLQSYLACGTPIIGAANGETAEIVKDSSAGFVSSPEDIEKLAGNIIRMSQLTSQELEELGNNARNYYDAHFDKDELLNRMDQYFV